ncbi:MAG TPA: substrate-binding domain-containing protein [Pirellulales bacterium]|nr:substrate-binding domain-containing protein [Pirellulales bacterium]
MSSARLIVNGLRILRNQRGWTQAQLAERAGISRTAVTAIEGNQLVPSVAIALALAEALETSVEAVFGRPPTPAKSAVWAKEPAHPKSPYWHAEVAGRSVLYPAEVTPMSALLPDGVAGAGGTPPEGPTMAGETLVIACCDPAAGVLASLFGRAGGLRLLVLHRSGRQALDLLKRGLVHMAGLHFSTSDEPGRNAETVRDQLGDGYQLLRMARWQEGIAVTPTLKLRSIRAALRSKLTWIGREPGSGARQCFDRLFESRRSPRRIARHHRGVAEAVQAGWADAGVCLRLASEEAGLDFLPVQEEAYDVCFPTAILHERRIQAFLGVVRSPEYRGLLGVLPGYDTSETGNLDGGN